MRVNTLKSDAFTKLLTWVKTRVQARAAPAASRAMPACAALSAPTSLVPSPHIIVVRPLA